VEIMISGHGMIVALGRGERNWRERVMKIRSRPKELTSGAKADTYPLPIRLKKS